LTAETLHPLTFPISTILQSELENLQRLEELERRQRLLSATGAGGLAAMGGGGDRTSSSMDISGASGPIIRDERIPGRPSAAAAVDGGGGVSAAAAASAGGGAAASKKSSKAAAASKSNNDDGNGEELEKTPGSVIVPCRARGMPMDHNFKVRQEKRRDGMHKIFGDVHVSLTHSSLFRLVFNTK
jgi:hypothetical protein